MLVQSDVKIKGDAAIDIIYIFIFIQISTVNYKETARPIFVQDKSARFPNNIFRIVLEFLKSIQNFWLKHE